MDPTFGKKILHTYQYNSDNSEPINENLIGSLIENVDTTNYFFRNPVFEHYGALKLANLDAIYKFTGHMLGIINPIIDDDFDDMYFYLDLCCGKGGFTEYMIYRLPKSKGSGITLNNENIYDASGNFTLCREGNGNILSNPDQVADFFTKRYPPVMVSLCDGVINEKPLDIQYKNYVGSPNSDSIVELSEINSNKTQVDILKAQPYIAMCSSQNNALMIFRLSNPLNWEEGQVVQNLSAFFKKITLIRPITSLKGEVYLVAEGYDFDKFKFKIPVIPIKKGFYEWFSEGAQLVKSPANLPKNYVDQCLIKWGLPSGSKKIIKNIEKKSLALKVFNDWADGEENNWEYLFEKYFHYLNEKNQFIYPKKEFNPIIMTKNHLYNITTKRGTRLTLVKSRVNYYLYQISKNWNYLEEIIDWYAPFGFIGFRKLENNYIIDAMANPFTRCSKKWYSLFGEEGSLGCIFESTIIKECQIFIYPSIILMDKIYELFKDNKITKMIIYCPRWVEHLLFDYMKNVELKIPDLVDYTTGEDFSFNIPYVRGVLENF